MATLSLDKAMEVALEHHRAGRLRAAEELYRQVLAMNPKLFQAMHFLAIVAAQTGRFEMAIDAFQRAIALNPGAAEVHTDLGNVLVDVDQVDQAIASHRRAIGLRPDYAEAHSNLGVALIEAGRFDEAIAACRRAMELKSDFVQAQYNLATALRDSGRLVEAIEFDRRAALANPDSIESQWNLGVSLLLAGDFLEGWRKLDWRINRHLQERPFTQPRWNGENLEEKTILLRADPGGFGDTLQFVRYVPLVAERGGKVILECQPQLARLLQNFSGAEKMIAFGQPLPECDVQTLLMALPLVFETTLQTVPGGTGYVKPDAALVESWKNKLGPKRARLRVGLVWAGGPTPNFKRTRARSLNLSHLAPLAKAGDVEFFSLQKGDAARQQRPPGLEMGDFTDELDDFADTAALMENLDLIVSVDTSMAHLAGALGKRVWVLLPFVADWRWMRDRDDSPWYPSMRLFRQNKVGDWDGAVANLLEQLRKI